MDTEKWGRVAARERYNGKDMKKESVNLTSPHFGSAPPREAVSKDVQEFSPQAPEDKTAPGYSNLTPNNWLRGMGPGQACGKPGFDYQKKGK